MAPISSLMPEKEYGPATRLIIADAIPQLIMMRASQRGPPMRACMIVEGISNMT